MIRLQLALGLILTVSGCSVPVAYDKPIPQDVDRMERRSRERFEWHRRTLEVAYDQIGKKDPRWDQSAREALDIAARVFSQSGDPLVVLADVNPPAKAAVEAGCGDPMILYLYARSSTGGAAPSEKEVDRRLQLAFDAMATSGYSPYRRAVASLACLERRMNKKGFQAATGARLVQPYLNQVYDLLAASTKEDLRGEDWENAWFRTINVLITLQGKLENYPEVGFNRVDERLGKIVGIEPLRLTIKGNFYFQQGWNARSTEVGAKVSPDQFRQFQSRLRDAREVLTEAWKLDPNEPLVASLMLKIEKGIGGGDRQTMETWFTRALQADGYDRNSCWEKLDWLDPKWHGGLADNQAMAFGKACGATKESGRNKLTNLHDAPCCVYARPE